jgi:beta-glucuronidase
MRRRFREHDLRLTQDMTGIWDFCFLGDVDPDAVDVAALEYDDRMAVPGCFDATPRYAGKRGLTAYRTTALVYDDTPHRLVLDAVHHWCRVFVDGQALSDHVGGFTRFQVDLPRGEAGEVEIIVLVDNRLDYDRCPLHLGYFDWYHFGGIARGAELHRLGGLWIDRFAVTTVDYAARRIAVSVDYKALDRPGQTEFSLTCDGYPVIEETIDLLEPSGTLTREIELAGAALWSPDAPNLHLLHVTLDNDDCADDAYERVGIRQVRVQEQQILINDQPVRLLGYCRHAAHPEFGHGLPEAIQIADIQLLQDLGCNFLRGSHYPQDLRFLDLCDEAGICVWNEAIGWQHTIEHLTDPRFVDAQLSNIEEMVAMSANRPSVIMWGILNESHSHEIECRPAYETLLGRLRELDPTRPVTYASNHPFNDLCLDLVDVVAINCYPGWYGGEIADIPDALDQIVHHLDVEGQPEGITFADKPLIISEIGAGAIPGWRDVNETRWSEQYQARLLDTVLRHLFVDRARACGISLWQFCDCRASEQVRRALFRPRAFNNKGIVDEYRRPKLAYEVVKRYFAVEIG